MLLKSVDNDRLYINKASVNVYTSATFKRLIFEDLKCKQLGRWYLKSNIGHNKYVWKQKEGIYNSYRLLP